MLDTTVNSDDDSQYFATPRKHNQSTTAKISHVPLRSCFMQCQQNITHNMTSKKLPPSGRSIIVLKMMVKVIEAHSVPNKEY